MDVLNCYPEHTQTNTGHSRPFASMF